MRFALLVAAGGAAGSLARYLAGLALADASRHFPWSTLAINVAGSLLLGLVLALTPAGHPSPARLALGVGVCGGFTTFSTFSAETVALLERGHVARAAAYALGSVALALVATLAGLAAGRALAAGR